MSTTDLSRTARTRIADTTVWIVLAAGAIFMLAPLLWMVSTSLKTQLEVFALPPVWIPEVPQWDTYVRMWQDSYVLSGLKNSAIVAFSVTIIGTLTCSLAAFALAKMRLPARNVIFIGLLSGIMIPFPTLMIPQFVIFAKIGWVDTLLPLIVPAIFGNIVMIFFLRQYLFKRYFLNGWAGFIASVGGAFYVFLKYAKLHEARRTGTGDRGPGTGHSQASRTRHALRF